MSDQQKSPEPVAPGIEAQFQECSHDNFNATSEAPQFDPVPFELYADAAWIDDEPDHSDDDAQAWADLAEPVPSADEVEAGESASRLIAAIVEVAHAQWQGIKPGFELKLPAPPVEVLEDQPFPGRRAGMDVHHFPPVPPDSWPHAEGKQMYPLNTLPNLRRLLDHYGFCVGYDVIRKDLRVTYPGQRGTLDNQAANAASMILSLCALNRLAKTDAMQFLLTIADETPINPVMDWIGSQPWDGTSRFSDLLDTIGIRPGYDRVFAGLLLRRWLISAVAAAAKPSGFWSKGVLVFQGPQSIGKTTWIRSLVPAELRDLLKIDATISPDHKDSVISAVSHWIVELGELDGTLRRADIARLKGFISQDVDQFRRPYARAESKYQRRTVFFASVNPEQFLADETGNVRWWTIPVTSLDCQHGIDLQQLWAEVYEWFKSGERWYLDAVEEALLERMNGAHQQTDPIEEMIAANYAPGANGDARELTATEVLLELGMNHGQITKRHTMAASTCLRRLFGEPVKRNRGRLFSIPQRRIVHGRD